MRCRDLIGFLLDYEEGRLAPEVRATFEEHVGRCPPCRDYLGSYRATVELAAGLDVDESACDPMPEELVQAILSARRRAR